MKAAPVQLLPVFARHETFHPRIGWLTKAVDAVVDDPFVFTSEEAPLKLGVGKNMARAIKFWGLATKVIAEDPGHRQGRVPAVKPTRFGHALLGEGGWDRYLEDAHSLWLLHYQLLRPPSRVPVFWWSFREFEGLEFTAEDLERFAQRRISALGWPSPAPKSIGKDVDCMLRMYGRRVDGNDGWLDSPFAGLGLIERAPGRQSAWTRTRVALEQPDPRVVGYACLDAMSMWAESARTVSIARLASAADGPGRVLGLTELQLVAALRVLESDYQQIRISAPAGFQQLAVSEAPGELALRLLLDLNGSAPTKVYGHDTDSFVELADAA